jgi:hypothetical protein
MANHPPALRALELGQPANQRRRCRLLTAMGDALYRAGSFEEARSTFAAGPDGADRAVLHLSP